MALLKRFIDEVEHCEQALTSRSLDPGTIREAAALVIKGANPLQQTGYKLQLLEEQLVDMLESLSVS